MKFETGKIYRGRSVCNYDSVIDIEVLKRTPKTISVKFLDGGLYSGRVKSLRITTTSEGYEYVKPWGSYSMAPQVSAERTVARL